MGEEKINNVDLLKSESLRKSDINMGMKLEIRDLENQILQVHEDIKL